MTDAARQVLDELVAAMQVLPSMPAVYEDPTEAIAEAQIPAVAVEPVRNPATPLGESHGDDWIEQHRFLVGITALGRSPAERDQLGLEAKQAVIASTHVGLRRRYVDTEYGRTTEGALRAYGARVLFEIEYLTQSTAPDQMI